VYASPKLTYRETGCVTTVGGSTTTNTAPELTTDPTAFPTTTVYSPAFPPTTLGNVNVDAVAPLTFTPFRRH
jgi:hypothetical protein